MQEQLPFARVASHYSALMLPYAASIQRLPYGDARLMSLKIGIHPFLDDIVFRLKNFT